MPGASITRHIRAVASRFVAANQGNTGIFDLLRVLTLWGWLSTLLLIAGIAFIAREERRATSNGVTLKDSLASSFWLKPRSAQYAATALARTQLGTGPALQGATR